MLWKIYAVGFCALNAYGLLDYAKHPTRYELMPWVVQLAITPFAIAGLYAYAFKKAWLGQNAWTAILGLYVAGSVVQIVMDVAKMQESSAGANSATTALVVAVKLFLTVPVLVALYRNAFRPARPAVA